MYFSMNMFAIKSMKIKEQYLTISGRKNKEQELYQWDKIRNKI